VAYSSLSQHVSDAFLVQLGWLDSPHALEATVQRLKEVKSVGIDVGLDFHGRVHKTLAKQLAAALEPHKPLFIEEPLLPGQVPEMEKLYQRTNIPIAVCIFIGPIITNRLSLL
jgi:galactonate dehydratase